MPTVSRLVAALCLAITAVITSELIKPLMLEGLDFGWFVPINAGLALVLGWQVIGSRVGRGWTPAINNGLTAGLLLFLWALFLQSGYKMFTKSMRNLYDGAFEAAAEVFSIMVDYAVEIGTVEVIGSLVIGSILSGIAAEVSEKLTR